MRLITTGDRAMFSQNTSKQSYSIVHDVIKFRDSPFLFLSQTDTAQKQFQHFTGEISLSEDKLVKFQENIQFNREYSEKSDVPYHHIVF